MRQGLTAVAVFITLGVYVPAQSPAAKKQLHEESLWTAAVQGHRPGSLDLHAEAIGRWPWSRLKPVLIRLAGRADAPLLLRAATLYVDVALLVPLAERPRYPTGGHQLNVEDGRSIGSGDLDSHIWWARQILLLQAWEDPDVDANHRALAIAWLRAVTAMLSANMSLANAEPNIFDAVREFPTDAGTLFDAGCLAETFASPMIQAVIGKRTRSQLTQFLSLSGVERTRDENLLEAGRYFRRVLEHDPSMMEARVRLARVLMQQHRNGDAARELELALTMHGAPAVHYFAEMFRGQALEADGTPETAAKAYERAASLFPTAQSPPLALSALRVDRGDIAAARAAIRPLWNRPAGMANETTDPWLEYGRCAGRDAIATYSELGRRIQALPRGSLEAER